MKNKRRIRYMRDEIDCISVELHDLRNAMADWEVKMDERIDQLETTQELAEVIATSASAHDVMSARVNGLYTIVRELESDIVELATGIGSLAKALEEHVARPRVEHPEPKKRLKMGGPK